MISAIGADSPFVLRDESRHAIPRENLSSLATFLSLKRRETVHGLTLANVPKEQQAEAKALIESIRGTRFFDPDRKPKAAWRVFYGDTWSSAFFKAKEASRVAVGTSRFETFFWSGQDVERAANKASRSDALEAVLSASRVAAEEALKRARLTELIPETQLTSVAWWSAINVSLLIVKDLEFRQKQEYVAFVEEVWTVLKKGYGIYNDVDGEFFVYCKRKRPRNPQ